MKAQKTLLIGNIVALAAVLTVNALANILPINGMNTGQISNLYPSLFTPAGFTFSIWSIIYLLLIAFAVGQFVIKDKPYFKELSLWFLLSCLANASWILVWHYLFTAASVVFMLILLYSLTRIFLLLQSNEFTKT
ncbi:MAG: tryptophan-rich sensory protein, partial [Cyclobacteriaceae bacterium]